MTAPSYKALRQALYTRLDAALSVPVWSPKAPQADDSELLGPFPLVVIVQANESPWNTKGSRGLDAVVQIDGYARTTATDSAEDLATGLAANVREALEIVREFAGDMLTAADVEIVARVGFVTVRGVMDGGGDEIV